MNATDKKYRDKLENFEMKPSDRVWEQIESALPEEEEEKGKVVWFYWAAAASIVLMFSLGWMSRDMVEITPNQEQLAEKETKSNTEETSSNETESTSISPEKSEEKTQEKAIQKSQAPTPVYASMYNEKTVPVQKTNTIALIDTKPVDQKVLDTRRKIKVNIEFNQPDEKTLMASADNPKMSVGDYAQKQWAAINTLNVKKLQTPKGNVAMPKIDAEPIKNFLNKTATTLN